MKAHLLQIIICQAWKWHTLHGFPGHWLEFSHLATSNHKGGWEMSTSGVPRKMWK